MCSTLPDRQRACSRAEGGQARKTGESTPSSMGTEDRGETAWRGVRARASWGAVCTTFRPYSRARAVICLAVIFHIDVNSAYLSWTAVEELKEELAAIRQQYLSSLPSEFVWQTAIIGDNDRIFLPDHQEQAWRNKAVSLLHVEAAHYQQELFNEVIMNIK